MLTTSRKLVLVLCVGALALHSLPINAQVAVNPLNGDPGQVLSSREQAEKVLELIKDPNPKTRLEGLTTFEQFATLDLKLELLGDSNSLIRLAALKGLVQEIRASTQLTYGEQRSSSRAGGVRTSRQSVQFSNKSYTENLLPRRPKIKERLEALGKDEKEIAELAASCLALIDLIESFKAITLAEGIVEARKEPPEGKLEIQKGLLVLLGTDGNRVAEFGRYGHVNCWSLHANNRWLAIGCGDTSAGRIDRGGGYTKKGVIEIYDLKTNQMIKYIEGAYHFGPVTQIGFDGDRLLYGASDYEESGAP